PLHPTPAAYFGDANLQLVKLYAVEGRREDAQATIWHAYDLADPKEHPSLLAMWMRSELERIDPEEAAATLRTYVAADPEDVDALRALARNEQALRQTAEARRHFQACLKLRPNDLGLWRDWLAVLQEQGDLDGLNAALAGLPKGADRDG